MQTEILKALDLSRDELKERLKDAAEIIKRGGLVVFPTETVYGLGADATNAKASKAIYAAKGRPSDNPLIIHISDPCDAEKYAQTNELYYRLAKRFMPGPLTVVLSAKASVPRETRGGLDTVAVRCPENPIARELIALSGVPIAAPSANLSGSPSPTNVSHVIDDMMGRVDMIIDGGDSDFGLESTIVKIDGDILTLLRPGKITPDELSYVAEVKIADAVLDKLSEGAVALSPGMKYRHYAPKSPMLLLSGDFDAIIGYISSSPESRKAVIAYSSDVESFRAALPDAEIFDFGEREDVESQAHVLFSLLRELDKLDFDKIFAPLPKADGVGLALYNRLIRASAYQIIRL